MFSNRVRLVLVALVVVGAVLCLARGRTLAGVALLVSAALGVAGYWRCGPVWLAFRALRSGNSDRARVLLAQVRRPRALGSQQRAYYELALGLLARDQPHPEEAESHLREALAHRLRSDNDRALVEFLLAQVFVARGDGEAGRVLIQGARARNCGTKLAKTIDDYVAAHWPGTGAPLVAQGDRGADRPADAGGPAA